jgi:uncharacterized Tic20 family protein
MSDVQQGQEYQLPALTNEAKNWGMLCHLSALAGLVVPGLAMCVGPLIVWLVKRNDHPFIDDQGKESLNFQLSMLIYVVLLCCIVIGIPIALLLIVANVILVIVASIKASGGEAYRYPLTIRLIR